MILFWKLGPWNYRKRIASHQIPEGWKDKLEQIIPNFSAFDSSIQLAIQDNLKILMAEKQWNTDQLNENIYNLKLQALCLGAWLGAFQKDHYFSSLENLELGPLSQNVSFSLQYDNDGLYSEKWFQPKLLSDLGINDYPFIFRGVISEWLAHLSYSQEHFKSVLENETFDLSLFPLFGEVYFSSPEILLKVRPRIYGYFQSHFSVS